MTKDTSPPAFPARLPQAYMAQVDNIKDLHLLPPQYTSGMTLRQYAAIKAMQGLLSSTDSPFSIALNHVNGSPVNLLRSMSVEIADALIAELEKGQTNETN